MAARRKTMTGLALVLAALTMAGIVWFGRRDDPDSPRRRPCGCCTAENPLDRWKLRAWALVTPGPGRAARIRYALGRAEYAERARLGMPMNHPDWISAELPPEYEEALAELDAETWEPS